MRKSFAGYYRPTDDQFAVLWGDCVFCFDANVILNIYRYTPPTRDAFLAILRGVKDRIWLPHQAAAEYHDNRLEVISHQHRAYEAVRDQIDKDILGSLTALENAYARHPLIDIRAVTGPIREAAANAQKLLEQGHSDHPDYLTDDPLREALADIFEGRVGDPYTEDRLKKLYKEAEERFERKQPPGYLDAKKEGGRKYGDVVLWTQIMEHAEQKKKPVVFVTDDRKDDWWQRHSGRTLGPRPQLVQEFTARAGVPFYMYASDQFIDHAQRFLKLADQQPAVEETRRIKERDEAIQRLHDLLVPAAGESGDAATSPLGVPVDEAPTSVVAPRPFSPPGVLDGLVRPAIPHDILAGLSRPIIPPSVFTSLTRPLIPTELLRDIMKPPAHLEAFQSVVREIAAQSAMLKSAGFASIARDLAAYTDIMKSASGLGAVQDAVRAMARERSLVEDALRGVLPGRAGTHGPPAAKPPAGPDDANPTPAADKAEDRPHNNSPETKSG